MPEPYPTPRYYEGLSQSDMLDRLKYDYLTKCGFLESAEAKLSLRDGEPIPWFTYPAIRFLEQEITKDLSIFEYGGGQSTLYWSRRVKHIASVDHDPAFEDHVRQSLPDDAEFYLIPEEAPLSDKQKIWAERKPDLPEPERNIRTYRSGQLNEAFQGYALKLLEYPSDTFDVVIVDGMARVMSTWAAIQHFSNGGFIVFDNSDRAFYQRAFDLLQQAGYRRIDFWGMGPINPYEWCTSIFYHPNRFPGTGWFLPVSTLPQENHAQADDGLGILVIGYNRPFHLQSVLESLRQQGRLNQVHVWIDGTQGRGEYQDDNTKSIAIAKRYSVKKIHVVKGHLGIEKIMLDALDFMSQKYSRVLVLEDDCFPVEGAIDQFEMTLLEVKERCDIYSVYGHHFATEPKDTRDFSRFQGWGWAAHSQQIRAYLPRLTDLFLKSEAEYSAFVAARLTSEVCERLDVTPGRNVLNVLQSFFSWDSATALLTAIDNVSHRRTETPVVKNTGIIEGVGHFREDRQHLRQAPFNMITIDEAWGHFDTSTTPCDRAKPSYGLDRLDVLIKDAIPDTPGFFIELGAYDGVMQSNSILFEASGWNGLLVEPNPANYAKCVRARPNAIVEHAACVASDYQQRYTTITDVGLMSMTNESVLHGGAREEWLVRGESFIDRKRQEIDVPAETLSSILDKHHIEKVNLMLLDVEGAEIEVLKGLDMTRHAPEYIVAEDAYEEALAEYLATVGYKRTRVLLERKFTRDCLYKKLDQVWQD